MKYNAKEINKNTRVNENGIYAPRVSFYKGQANKENAIAYCHSFKHMGYLGEGALKQHQCIQKKCIYLEKYETNAYWIKRDVINALKKYTKNENCGQILINGKLIKNSKKHPYNIKNLLGIAINCANSTNEKPIIEYIKEENKENTSKTKKKNQIKQVYGKECQTVYRTSSSFNKPFDEFLKNVNIEYAKTEEELRILKVIEDIEEDDLIAKQIVEEIISAIKENISINID